MSDDKTPRTTDEGRSELLQTIVPIFLTVMALGGMIVALILGYLVGVAIFALVLIIFGSLASGVVQLGVDVRRDGVRYTAERKQRVHVDADYRVEELVSPPPSRGRDAA